MRIVDVNEFYSPTGGGVRTYVDRKMRILANLGHELIVLAPGRQSSVETRPDGGQIHWIKAPRLPFDQNYGLFWDVEPLTRLLDVLAPDVVETSSPLRPAWIIGNWKGNALKVFFAHNDNLAAYPQRWLEGVAHPDQVARWFGWYTRYMARALVNFDAFVTNGHVLERRYEKRGLKVHAAVPLGIDSGFFSPDLRDEGLRASLLSQCGLPASARLLLGVGRHHPEKRWPTIIDAVKAVSGSLPVGLIVLGDGMGRKKLERRAVSSPNIQLLPPIYDRRRFATTMASADALIHGSEIESFGLVALEALASGIPLIVPDEGGTAEIARPQFAECFRAGNIQSCGAAIRRMAGRDPQILQAALRSAASSVRTDHDHAAALINYYESLLVAKQ